LKKKHINSYTLITIINSIKTSMTSMPAKCANQEVNQVVNPWNLPYFDVDYAFYMTMNVINIITFLILAGCSYIFISNVGASGDSSCGNIFEWGIFSGIFALFHVILMFYDTACCCTGCCEDTLTKEQSYKRNLSMYNMPRKIITLANFAGILWIIFVKLFKFSDTCADIYATNYDSLYVLYITMFWINIVTYSILLFTFILANYFKNKYSKEYYAKYNITPVTTSSNSTTSILKCPFITCICTPDISKQEYTAVTVKTDVNKKNIFVPENTTQTLI